MAKKWIQGAIKKPGSFTKQAKAKGMTPAQFQDLVLRNTDKFSKKTVQRARLRKTLVGMEGGGELLNALPQLLPLLDLAVPGLGTGASLFTQTLSNLTRGPIGQPLDVQTSMYTNGGVMKKYKGRKHEQGGIPVDANGNPVAEVEGGEVGLTGSKGDTYIFSDKLGTAEKLMKIYDRVKGKDSISRETRKKVAEKLIKENENLKFRYGGEMEYEDGGILSDKIAKLVNEGYPQKQAIAIAYSMQRRGELENGGDLKKKKNNSGDTASEYGFQHGGGLVTDDAIINPDQQITLIPGQVPLLPTLSSTGVKTWDRLKLPTKTNEISPLPSAEIKPLETRIPKISLSQTPNYDKSDILNKRKLNLGDVGLGLKGASLLGSAIDAFQKPEREKARIPDYTRGDELVQGTGISPDILKNEINLGVSKALDVNRQSSRNFGQFAARSQSALSRGARDKAGQDLVAKQYNDQLAMRRAVREDQKATTTAGALREVDVANLQNRAMRQDAIANLMNNVNNLGTELTRQQALKEQVNNMNENQKKDFLLKAAAINMQNPNFQIGSLDEVQKALDMGDYDSVIKTIVRFKQ